MIGQPAEDRDAERDTSLVRCLRGLGRWWQRRRRERRVHAEDFGQDVGLRRRVGRPHLLQADDVGRQLAQPQDDA
jgi:hypothetical protein